MRGNRLIRIQALQCLACRSLSMPKLRISCQIILTTVLYLGRTSLEHQAGGEGNGEQDSEDDQRFGFCF